MADQPHDIQPAADGVRKWTVLEVLNWTRDHFTRQGIENPRLDAEILLAKTLEVERIQLYVKFDMALSTQERERFRALVQRRAAREPISSILGRARFMGLEFEVGPEVLCPRAETELMVEWLLDRMDAARPWLAADICAGSGAIAVSAAAANEMLEVVATDISEPALEIARKNAENLGVAHRVRFLHGHLLDPLAAEALAGQFDFVLCNPPYIPSSELAYLMPEVRDFDPVLALDGGEDGLDFHREIVPGSREYLKPGGWLALEIGVGQDKAVAGMARESGFDSVTVKPDLAGIPRFLLARM